MCSFLYVYLYFGVCDYEGMLSYEFMCVLCCFVLCCCFLQLLKDEGFCCHPNCLFCRRWEALSQIHVQRQESAPQSVSGSTRCTLRSAPHGVRDCGTAARVAAGLCGCRAAAGFFLLSNLWD